MHETCIRNGDLLAIRRQNDDLPLAERHTGKTTKNLSGDLSIPGPNDFLGTVVVPASPIVSELRKYSKRRRKPSSAVLAYA